MHVNEFSYSDIYKNTNISILYCTVAMLFYVHACSNWRSITVDQIRLKVITLSLDRGPVRIGRDSLSCIDGVVFMVDAVDKERLNEAKKELDVSHYSYCHCDLPHTILACMLALAWLLNALNKTLPLYTAVNITCMQVRDINWQYFGYTHSA